MPNKAVFAGLIVDENDQPVGVAMVGDEPCYVVDDNGFRRHVPSESVDRQVFDHLRGQMEGHEDLISQETARMLGQEDIFTTAMIMNQLKSLDQQFAGLLQVGIPEEMRAYLGMIGFRVVINLHGEVIRVDQPSVAAEDEGE